MKKNRIIKALLFLFIITSLMLNWSPFTKGTAEAKTFRLIIGAGHPPVVIWIQRLQSFFCAEVAKRVKEKTGDEIKWVHAYGGTVAQVGEVLEAVQGGSLDLGLVATPFEPTKLYIHNFSYFVPFSLNDIMQMSDVGLKVYDEVPYLKDVFEQKYNQKYLSALAGGGYVMSGNFAWKTIDDLKGKKIGGAGPNLTWIKAVGAVPVQVTFANAYTIAKTGVTDAGLTQASPLVSLKLYEIAEYFADCGFGAVVPSCLTINLDRWKELPDEVKEIMLKVSREYSYDQARAVKRQDERAVKFLKKKGMKMYTLPFEERVKWANKLPDIPSDSAKKGDQMGMPGTEVIKRFISLQEQAGHKFPRRWVVK